MNSELKIVTIIQARTGSTRLPGKVLLPLAGKELLIRQIERISASPLSGTVVIAIPDARSDDALYNFCKSNNFNVFRGHPTDLLDRHYKAARFYEAEAIVKIPSDCPLIDPAVITRVITYYLENIEKYDYVSNLHPPTYPDGNDVEIFTLNTLKRSFENAALPWEREHTTPYMWENPDLFRIGNVNWESGLDYSMTERWTIDYYEDYLFIKEVYKNLYYSNPLFNIKDILQLLKEKPELRKINERYLGVNWYRNHLDQLKTISPDQTKQI